MKEYNEIGTDDMLEWAKMNGMNLSEGQAKELVSDEKQDIDLDEWFKENKINPIGEYENLSKKMRAKIKEIMGSLKEEKEQLEQKLDQKENSDDRDEKDNLDEKDGKEELDNDKKEKVKETEKERQKEQSGEEPTEEQEKKAKDEEEISDNKGNKEDQGKEKTPKKDEYLAKVEKLHRMKIADYKDQMRKDDARMDKYFITMIYLQRELSRSRNAFVKEYGDEELITLENQYLREEQKYQKTLDIRMETDLSKLRQLDEKLDSILDRMQDLQNGLEKGSIDLEEYNDMVNALEKYKLDTLWQINRLNPSLLEEKQERIEQRDEYEQRRVPRNIQKEKSVNPELKAKQKALDYMEKKQEGASEEYHDNIKYTIQDDIDEKERRLDKLRKELKGIDIESSEGKKRALEVIGEIQTLESQKASQEVQQKNLEKNMGADIQSYGDLKKSEKERHNATKEFQEVHENIMPEEVSDDLMYQLKNQALEDPSTPEQAEEYLDNLSEISEKTEKEQNQEKENDENEPPTLWNRRKRPF